MAEATAAQLRGDRVRAAQQQALGDRYQEMQDAYQQRLAALEIAAADRATWEAATRQQRQAAVAADAELRRRHPGQPWEPLRSAEPEEAHARALLPGLEELAARHRDFDRKRAERDAATILLGPAPEAPGLLAPRRSSAILQPPPPQIPASPHILSRAAERDQGWEAGS